MTPEQVELTRQCAERIAADHAAGRAVDPHSLQWARDFVRLNSPLGRPLGTGEPSRVCAQTTEQPQ